MSVSIGQGSSSPAYNPINVDQQINSDRQWKERIRPPHSPTKDDDLLNNSYSKSI